MTDAAASDGNKTIICIIYLAYQFVHFRYIFNLTVDLCSNATPSYRKALPLTHTLSLCLSTISLSIPFFLLNI